jgi:hypothetical protein
MWLASVLVSSNRPAKIETEAPHENIDGDDE